MECHVVHNFVKKNFSHFGPSLLPIYAILGKSLLCTEARLHIRVMVAGRHVVVKSQMLSR